MGVRNQKAPAQIDLHEREGEGRGRGRGRDVPILRTSPSEHKARELFCTTRSAFSDAFGDSKERDCAVNKWINASQHSHKQELRMRLVVSSRRGSPKTCVPAMAHM